MHSALNSTRRVAVTGERGGHGHHLVMRRSAALGDPVMVMQPLRAVATQTDEEIVLF